MAPSTAIMVPMLAMALNAEDAGRKATAWQVVEWSFTSTKACESPFNEIELDAVFTGPDGGGRVPAFWAGRQTWKLRFAAGELGRYTFHTECSDPSDAGLHGRQGWVDVEPYSGDNALYRHGPIRVAAGRRHFEHADGTPFLWLGDTWWMGLTRRLAWEEFQWLTRDRAEKGFNVVQIVAGLYPDMPAFDERGENEAGFPWERDYSAIRPVYFDMADRRIAFLADAGLAPCIVGAWGYHLPWLGVDRMKQHWRYLVARYGAYPVIWCLAGEGTMPYYLSQDKAADAAFQKKGWTEIGRYVRRIDPYQRLITNHPSQSSRETVEDVSVLDFDMLQTGHGDRASMPNTVRAVKQSLAAAPIMPVIVSEVCYEGILGYCLDPIQRYAVWASLLSGTAGHTYGANGIWQVNQTGKPFGKSPHGGDWGQTPWDEAARLAGSLQTGLARKLLERYPWQELEPRPEWAVVDVQPSSATWGDWIWFDRGDPAKDAPVRPCLFRKSFEVPEGSKVTSAVLRATADDRLTAFLNGREVGGHSGWETWREFDVTADVRPGRNVLAVRAENLPAPVQQNPAGLLCSLKVELAGGQQIEIHSDSTWRSLLLEGDTGHGRAGLEQGGTGSAEGEPAAPPAPGWERPEFDDGAWPRARSAAKYGQGPWGIFGIDEMSAPFAAGIPGRLRIIYMPAPVPIMLKDLEPDRTYEAVYFSPIDGSERAVGSVRPDEGGSGPAPRPPSRDQDWILILQTRQGG